MTVNLAATGAYAVGFVIRAGDPAGPVGWGRVSLSVAALAALSFGGYLGGELAYRYGVRVAGETTQAEGYQPAVTKPSRPPDSAAKEKV
jgi:uncharacterized membrane protein